MSRVNVTCPSCFKTREIEDKNLYFKNTQGIILPSRLVMPEARSKHCRSCARKVYLDSEGKLYHFWKRVKKKGQVLGIEPDWFKFSSFKSWALGNGYRAGKGLRFVRVDKKQGFFKTNCKFVKQKI